MCGFLAVVTLAFSLFVKHSSFIEDIVLFLSWQMFSRRLIPLSIRCRRFGQLYQYFPL